MQIKLQNHPKQEQIKQHSKGSNIQFNLAWDSIAGLHGNQHKVIQNKIRGQYLNTN